MTNYFIVHGSFGDSKEHWIPWLKEKLEKLNVGQVVTINFPIGMDKQNYQSWKKELDKYKHLINKDTIFIGRSIGPIFIVKYLTENHLKINSLYSISGFNGYINVPDYDYVNQSFLLDEVNFPRKLCKKRICFISKNDPYVPYYLLDMFAKNIKAKVIMKEQAGHFNTDSGYATFDELYNLITK